jgi:addiction module HigA family antidote
VLLHDYLVPLCLTPTQLAREIDAPTSAVTAILDGEHASDALCDRLAKYFGTAPSFWQDMQARLSA